MKHTNIENNPSSHAQDVRTRLSSRFPHGTLEKARRHKTTRGLLLVFSVALFCFSSARIAHANDIKSSTGHGALGVGAIVGHGLSVGGRYWLTPQLAGQIWLGSDYHQFGVRVSADILFAAQNLIPSLGHDLNFSLAVGGGLVAQGDNGRVLYHCHPYPSTYCHTGRNHGSAAVGVRVPLSFSLMLRKFSTEVFAETALRMDIVPFGRLDIEGGLGARYYF